MRKQILFFALGLFILCLIPMDASGTNEDDDERIGEKIEKAKEYIRIRNFQKKMEGLKLIKEVGVERFLATVTEPQEQIQLIHDILSGSSTTEGSIVKASILEHLLDTQNDNVKLEAIKGLDRLHFYSNKGEVIHKLFDLLKSKNPKVRLAAVDVFRVMGKKGVVKGFGLKDLDPEDVPIGLLPAFKDEDAAVRYAVTKVIRKTENEKVLAALRKLVKDDDAMVRRGAFEAFGRFQARDWVVGKRAIWTLRNDTAIEAKIGAASYLGRVKENSAIEVLGETLRKYRKRSKDASEDTLIVELKERVVNALGNIGDRKAEPYLVEAVVDNEHEGIRIKAGIRFQKLSGNSLGFHKDLVKAEREIVLEKFRVWWIEQYLGKGKERADELKQLKEEIARLEEESAFEIIVQKIGHSEAKVRREGYHLMEKMGMKEFASHFEKVEEKNNFLQRLNGRGLDIESLMIMTQVVAVFLDDEDDKVKLQAIFVIVRNPFFFKREIIVPKLTALTEYKKSVIAEAARYALVRLRQTGVVPGLEEKKEGERKRD